MWRMFRERHRIISGSLRGEADRTKIIRGVILNVRRSSAIWDIAILVLDKVITMDDLNGFSQDFQLHSRKLLSGKGKKDIMEKIPHMTPARAVCGQ